MESGKFEDTLAGLEMLLGGKSSQETLDRQRRELEGLTPVVRKVVRVEYEVSMPCRKPGCGCGGTVLGVWKQSPLGDWCFKHAGKEEVALTEIAIRKLAESWPIALRMIQQGEGQQPK